MKLKQCAKCKSNMLIDFESSMAFTANLYLGMQIMYFIRTTKGHNLGEMLDRITPSSIFTIYMVVNKYLKFGYHMLMDLNLGVWHWGQDG